MSTALFSAAAGRSLANPAKQLIELNPTYAPYANVSYNGTNLPDVFAPSSGGYYVNTTTTVYGYYRLFANATYLSVQVREWASKGFCPRAEMGGVLWRLLPCMHALLACMLYHWST